MDDEVIYITLDDIEVVDTSEYSCEIIEQFSTILDNKIILSDDAFQLTVQTTDRTETIYARRNLGGSPDHRFKIITIRWIWWRS